MNMKIQDFLTNENKHPFIAVQIECKDKYQMLKVSDALQKQGGIPTTTFDENEADECPLIVVYVDKAYSNLFINQMDKDAPLVSADLFIN